MKRIAIFGNAGGGKSTLARELAAITGLPREVIDKIQYRAGGAKVPHEEYLQAHARLLATDEWIIDGFGCMKSAWERFEAAHTQVSRVCVGGGGTQTDFSPALQARDKRVPGVDEEGVRAGSPGFSVRPQRDPLV